MIDSLIKRLKLLLVVTFIVGSTVFYYLLKNYHIQSVDLDLNNIEIYFFLLFEILMLITFILIHLIVRHFIIRVSQKDKFIAKQVRFAAMGEMISMIAHQWRQPLTGMGMIVNNLLLDIELQDVDEKKIKTNLQTVDKQISYLSATIDNFKNFFNSNIEPENINVKKLVKETCMIIGSSIKSAGVDIKIDISDDLTIFIKKNDVIQILLNIIKNSMDAYKENQIKNRVIEISAIDKPTRVELVVKDYAGGIPKEIINKVFDPYFTTKDSKNNAGLGLYMSKMIAEDHLSGYLDIKSENSSTTCIVVLIKESI